MRVYLKKLNEQNVLHILAVFQRTKLSRKIAYIT